VEPPRRSPVPPPQILPLKRQIRRARGLTGSGTRKPIA
jgi:hypothetical protein